MKLSGVLSSLILPLVSVLHLHFIFALVTSSAAESPARVTVLLPRLFDSTGGEKFDTVEFSSEVGSRFCSEDLNKISSDAEIDFVDRATLFRDCDVMISVLRELWSSGISGTKEIYFLLSPRNALSMLFVMQCSSEYCTVFHENSSFESRIHLLDTVKGEHNAIAVAEVYRLVPEFVDNQNYIGLNAEYTSDVIKAVYNDTIFNSFRNYFYFRNTPYLTIVYFQHFLSSPKLLDFCMEVFAYLKSQHPDIFQVLPILAGMDLSIQNTRMHFHLSSEFRNNFSETPFPLMAYFEQNSLADQYFKDGFEEERLSLSPLLLRYLMEISFLKNEFGNLEGYNIIEIGGGYGGMAVALQSLYGVQSYSIIDLNICGMLQKRFVSHFARLYPNFAINTIPPEANKPISSDLIVSFFAISELTNNVVNKYLQLYVQHARSGYLQLNMDGDNDELANANKKLDLVSKEELFMKIKNMFNCAEIRESSRYYDYFGQSWDKNYYITWNKCS